MIFVGLHMDEATRFDNQRLDDGSILVTLDTRSDAHHTMLTFDNAAALEAFYSFLGGVMAGVRFDALEEQAKSASQPATASS